MPPAQEQPGVQVYRVIPDPLPPAAPPAAEPVIRKVTIPAGTLVNVRMIDAINSDTDHVGQSFHASLADSIQLDGDTVVLKGADVYVKLVDSKSAGNMSGNSELKVQLDRIFVGKKSYTVESNTYVQTGASQGQKTAKTVGIGAAVGAAIGAITGGKKGAVIGAGVGGGSGAVIEAATKGEQVRIASEAPLTFRLEAPIEVTLSPDSGKAPPQQPNRFRPPM
jgi:YMGG-like Gly-zipper